MVDGINWNKAGFITKERYEESPEIMLQEEDILLSKDGTIGKTGFVDKLEQPTTVASGIFVIRNLKPEIINTRFIYYFLCSKYFKDFVTMRTEGSVIPHLYQKDFVGFDFPLPSKEIQRKIVSMLDDISSKIDINKEINNNLEQLISDIFKKMFGFNIDNLVESKFKLGDLIESIDNRGKTPPLSDKPTSCPIIDVKALSSNMRIVDYNKCSKYVDEETYNTWFRSGHPKQYDILFSTVGSLAEMKLFLGNVGCIAQNVVGFRSRGISPLYLYQYLKYIKNDLVAYNIGSVQPSIKITHIIKYPIYVASQDKINKFDSMARYITEKIFANCQENENLKQLRDTLLPKLMSGELDVSKIDL